MAFRRLGLPLAGLEPARRPKVGSAPAKERAERAAQDPQEPKARVTLAVPATGGTVKAKESKDKAPKTKILVAAAALGAKTKPLLRPRADVDGSGGSGAAPDPVAAAAAAAPAAPGAALRGRNLLGSVLSHLGSARKRLQMDRKAVMKPKLRMKQQLTRQRVAKSGEDEKEALELRLAEHYSHMMNFIRTRGEPILFYLPAKHNAETQKCLEETQRTIRRKIEMLPTHLGGGAADEEEEAEATED